MRQQIQKFGRALSGMVMPNIGAFIAWGFVTALFIPSGWWPNTQMARLVDPMLTYLLPLLIAYTAGRNVAGERGGVIGAIAAMGVIVGSDIPMFIGAMVMGPLGGYTIRWFDKLTQGRIKAGFEMLVSNFSIGILGMLLAILGYWVIGGAVTGLTLLVSNGVEVVIRHGLLPLVSLLVEPSKVLFLNNALNHGIFSPIGIEQARETGQSIMFLLETNPGPGLGVLLACWFFGRGNMRQSAPGAVIIQFCGGIHEIYFPYILARPALILAPVAGSAAGLLFFSLAGAGLVAPASPGSIISVLAMAPKGQTLVVLAGVLISTAVSLLMAAPFVRRAATAEDMPTGAIPATQGGAPAVKAAQYFPAHIRKVVFACDAGMGSSALGATRFRKRLSDAGIGMVVGNCAADGIPADADVVVCQSVLAGRIAGAGHGAALVVIDNFLADPALDALFARLAQQDGADAIPRAGGLPAGTADAQPSDAGLRRVGDAPDRMAAPQPDDAAGRSSGEVLRPGTSLRTQGSRDPAGWGTARSGRICRTRICGCHAAPRGVGNDLYGHGHRHSARDVRRQEVRPALGHRGAAIPRRGCVRQRKGIPRSGHCRRGGRSPRYPGPAGRGIRGRRTVAEADDRRRSAGDIRSTEITTYMTTGKVTITAPNGMHARPAGELVKLIRGLAPARITLRTAAREASAVSILSLLALGLKHGTEVEVCAEGGDEAAAVRAVTDFIAGIRE